MLLLTNDGIPGNAHPMLVGLRLKLTGCVAVFGAFAFKAIFNALMLCRRFFGLLDTQLKWSTIFL